jgi:hypothetical protein
MRRFNVPQPSITIDNKLKPRHCSHVSILTALDTKIINYEGSQSNIDPRHLIADKMNSVVKAEEDFLASQ